MSSAGKSDAYVFEIDLIGIFLPAEAPRRKLVDADGGVFGVHFADAVADKIDSEQDDVGIAVCIEGMGSNLFWGRGFAAFQTSVSTRTVRAFGVRFTSSNVRLRMGL